MTDVIADGMRVVCVDMLSGEVLIGVNVDMISGFDTLSEMEIIAIATPAITLEFVVEITCAEDVLADVFPIDVDMFADENANGLAFVMTPLDFTLSSPCEESMPFC